jgi:CRISPR-associated protein Cas1
MSWLVLSRKGTRLAVRGGGLVVMEGDAIIRQVQIDRLDEISILGDVEVSAAARRLIASHNLDTFFFDGAGRLLATMVAAEGTYGDRRIMQYKRTTDTRFSIAIARAMITGKIANQRAVLRRLRNNQSLDGVAASIGALRGLKRRVDEAASPERLLGVEGHAAAIYYRGISAALTHPDFSFERRTRRPPRDPFNACLSFGYAMLLSRIEHALRRVGLDVWIGFLHTPGANKPSLALDLMEEFRPLIDRLVLRLINRKQLATSDFHDPRWTDAALAHPEWSEDTSEPISWLDKSGRAILSRELGKLWKGRMFYGPLQGNHKLQDIFLHQAHKLRQAIEQDDAGLYTSFLLV